jgi:hypothetical protein
MGNGRDGSVRENSAHQLWQPFGFILSMILLDLFLNAPLND